MPDAPLPARQKPTRSQSRPAKSPEPLGNGVPCVIGGLLSGQPEAELLAKAAAGIARIQLVNDRLALLAAVLATRPDALVLPPFDTDRTSTASLVFRVRREVPGVAVLLLSTHPRGAGQPILRAAQLGAYVITSPTIAELREALASLLERQGLKQ